jgi:hypothetical protein
MFTPTDKPVLSAYLADPRNTLSALPWVAAAVVREATVLLGRAELYAYLPYGLLRVEPCDT